jgi:hypothetical protein
LGQGTTPDRSARHTLRPDREGLQEPGETYRLAVRDRRHHITRIWGVPTSHQPQWHDAPHRAHAAVKDRVRANKAMGLRDLASKDWTVNQGWVLAANIAANLDAWARLLGLHDQPDPLSVRLR